MQSRLGYCGPDFSQTLQCASRYCVTADPAQQSQTGLTASTVPLLPKPLFLQAGQIASTLRERPWQVGLVISRIIGELGLEVVQQMVAEALAIYSGEGLWLSDRGRKRTLGGVFFFLAKQRIGVEEWNKIQPKLSRHAQKVRARARAAAAVAIVDWDMLLRDISQLTVGEAMGVKIVVTGRPGTVKENPTFVTFILESGKVPALPQGLPEVKTGTRFLVMVTAKSWRNIKAAIANPEDKLIVEGFASLQPGFNGIVVSATNMTTKLIQMAKAEQQKLKQHKQE